MADRHANRARAKEKNKTSSEIRNCNPKNLNDSFSSNIIGTDLILSLMMNNTIMEIAPATEPTMVDIPTTEASMEEVLTTDCPMTEEPTKETADILTPDNTTIQAPTPEDQTTEIPMVEDPISNVANVESPIVEDPISEVANVESPIVEVPPPENPTAETLAPEIPLLPDLTDNDDELVIGEVLENVIKNSSLDNQMDMQELVSDDGNSPSDFLDYDDDDDNYKENMAVVPHNQATEDTDNCTVVATVGVEGQVEPAVEGEEVEYIVEKILDKKIDASGVVKYLVKWQNFSSKENSWEPLEHLVECDKAMQDFEISRALRLAGRHNNTQVDMTANGIDKANQATLKKRIMPSNHKEFEVNDVMGLTQVNNEKYFLISLANSTQKAFIRASLANTVFPSKVIDFYIKNLRWRPKVED